MSCEINDNPCDICEEDYCPDQLHTVHVEFADLKHKLAYYERMVKHQHGALLEFTHKYGAVLDCTGIRPRDLSHSASLARGDLAASMKFTPEHMRWRPLQSMRMLTEDLCDHERFQTTWEQWMEVDDSLPPFEELMTKR